MEKGGFMKGVLVLFAITLISGICFGGVYEITKLPIQESKMKADLATYQEVYPNAVDFKFDRTLQDAAEAAPKNFASTDLNVGSVEIPATLNAANASGNMTSHIFTGLSKDGYGGNIKVSIGVIDEGEITGIGFIEINETPGLSMDATNPDFKDQLKGETAERSNLIRSGDAGNDGIDAMNDATVASVAVTNAVNGVLYFAHNCIPQ